MVQRKCPSCQAVKVKLCEYKSLSTNCVYSNMKCSNCGFRWDETASYSYTRERELPPLETLAISCVEKTRTSRRQRLIRKRQKHKKVIFICKNCKKKSIKGGFIQVDKHGYRAVGVCCNCYTEITMHFSLDHVEYVMHLKEVVWTSTPPRDRNLYPGDVLIFDE